MLHGGRRSKSLTTKKQQQQPHSARPRWPRLRQRGGAGLKHTHHYNHTGWAKKDATNTKKVLEIKYQYSTKKSIGNKIPILNEKSILIPFNTNAILKKIL